MKLLIYLGDLVYEFKEKFPMIYYAIIMPLLIIFFIDYDMSFGHNLIYAFCLLLFCLFEILVFAKIASIYEIKITIRDDKYSLVLHACVYLAVFISLSVFSAKYATLFSNHICKIVNCINHIEKPIRDYDMQDMGGIDGVPGRYE